MGGAHCVKGQGTLSCSSLLELRPRGQVGEQLKEGSRWNMDQERELHVSGRALGRGFMAGSLEGWAGDLRGWSRQKVAGKVERGVDRSAGRSGKVSRSGAWGAGAGEKVEFWGFSLEQWKLWKGFKQKKNTLGIHFWKVSLDQGDMWLH